MYILSNQAINSIQSHKPGIISLLALALKCSEGSINRHIRENKEDGELSKTVVVDVIMQECRLTKDQVLEKVSVAVFM